MVGSITTTNCSYPGTPSAAIVAIVAIATIATIAGFCQLLFCFGLCSPPGLVFFGIL